MGLKKKCSKKDLGILVKKRDLVFPGCLEPELKEYSV